MNRETNHIKVEAKSFQDICAELEQLRAEKQELILESHKLIKELEEENQHLRDQLSRTTRFKMGLKLQNRKLTQERNQLADELDNIKSMGMFEFGNTFCNDAQLEEAGHQLARSLLGGK